MRKGNRERKTIEAKVVKRGEGNGKGERRGGGRGIFRPPP